MNLRDTRIVVIGCGNMGASLLQGLIDVGLPAAHVLGVEQDAGRRALVAERLDIQIHAATAEALVDADLVVLAVKPQQAEAVLAELAACDKPVPLLSVMAGVRVAQLRQGRHAQRRVVRAMPNLASRAHAGVTALYADQPADDPFCRLAESVMRSVGTVLWVQSEELMNAVTAVSGCGPAYFFLLAELVERHALGLGLDRHQARHLVLQSAFGAAKLAIAADTGTAALRREVSSPGGATEAAIEVLLDGGLNELVAAALKAAHRRAGELAGPEEPPHPS